MSNDKLLRFIFDHSDVRGEIISLEKSYGEILRNGDYPEPISTLLGEMVAAVGLLSATLKFDGILTLQARGEGELSLIMADCTRQHLLRGIAQLSPGATPSSGNLGELLGKGHLAITIDPAKGERYQGIVPLESATLSGCIEQYFNQSEQLPTRLWLFADGDRCGGLLLQALPLQTQTAEERDAYWQHLGILADTLKCEEFLSHDSETLLSRLFHQEQVRLFEPTDMAFGCSCSRDRTASMLKSMGEAEARSIIEEQGLIEIQCQFCHQQYRFDSSQINDIFSIENKTLH